MSFVFNSFVFNSFAFTSFASNSLAFNHRPRRKPMLERALPTLHPEITFGEDGEAHRPASLGAILCSFSERLARMLHVVGDFFAAGGALS